MEHFIPLRHPKQKSHSERIDAKELVICEASPGDAAYVAEILDRAFTSLRTIYRPVGEARARQSERYQEGTRLIAQWRSIIVGTCQFVERENHVHLIGLAVLPEYQRQGVARQLIDRVCMLAPRLGYRVVKLDTIRETGNVEVFKKLQFSVVRELVADWCVSDTFPCVNEVIMQRFVRPKRPSKE
jgi:predicted N-acetyltransferase YhbS